MSPAGPAGPEAGTWGLGLGPGPGPGRRLQAFRAAGTLAAAAGQSIRPTAAAQTPKMTETRMSTKFVEQAKKNANADNRSRKKHKGTYFMLYRNLNVLTFGRGRKNAR